MGRDGASILEVVAASFLISVAMAAAVPLLALSAHQARAARGRQVALQEVANVMERISVESRHRSWNEIEGSPREVSAEAAACLADVQLQIDTAEVPGPPNAVRVTVGLSWTDRAGAETAPVRLVNWFYDTRREAD